MARWLNKNARASAKQRSAVQKHFDLFAATATQILRDADRRWLIAGCDPNVAAECLRDAWQAAAERLTIAGQRATRAEVAGLFRVLQAHASIDGSAEMADLGPHVVARTVATDEMIGKMKAPTPRLAAKWSAVLGKCYGGLHKDLAVPLVNATETQEATRERRTSYRDCQGRQRRCPIDPADGPPAAISPLYDRLQKDDGRPLMQEIALAKDENRREVLADVRLQGGKQPRAVPMTDLEAADSDLSANLGGTKIGPSVFREGVGADREEEATPFDLERLKDVLTDKQFEALYTVARLGSKAEAARVLEIKAPTLEDRLEGAREKLAKMGIGINLNDLT